LAIIGRGLQVAFKIINIKPTILDSFFTNLTERAWQKKIVEILNEFRPDIVHSLGINQNWRNLCLPILDQKKKGKITVPWIYSSWGTDLTFYSDLSPQNKRDVKEIIQSVDYFISECNRDYELAVQYGLRGHFLGFLPAFGGIETGKMKQYRNDGPVSNRKNIYIKGRGVEDPVGKAMIILDAIEKLRDSLSDYHIYLGQATPSIIKRANEIKKKYGLKLLVLPFAENPEAVLEYIGSSRISISITTNDGLPASLVEAMTLGAFPIFSDLPSISEWITHGENGYLIDFNNPEKLAEYIQQALQDDDLVTQADMINSKIVQEKLEYSQIRNKVLSIYQHVAQSSN